MLVENGLIPGHHFIVLLADIVLSNSMSNPALLEWESTEMNFAQIKQSFNIPDN